MHLQRSASKVACSVVFLLSIQGCAPAGDSNEDAAMPTGEGPFDLELTGSVGDGPVASAMLRVLSKDNEILATAIGDQLAGYKIELRPAGKQYPLTIEASGGVDLVTGMPLEFTLSAATNDRRQKSVANLNPFSTIAVATARRMTGGLTQANIEAALHSVAREFNFGLSSQLSLDPMTTPIENGNIAEIVKDRCSSSPGDCRTA